MNSASLANAQDRVVWERAAALVVIGLVLSTTLTGCCSWAAKHCDKEWGAPTIVFGLTQSCVDLNCVCVTQDAVFAPPGGKVQFINTTHHTVTITPASDQAALTDLDGNRLTSLTVASGEIANVRVARSVSAGTQIQLNTSWPNGVTRCPQYPGPRIDTDRP